MVEQIESLLIRYHYNMQGCIVGIRELDDERQQERLRFSGEPRVRFINTAQIRSELNERLSVYESLTFDLQKVYLRVQT